MFRFWSIGEALLEYILCYSIRDGVFVYGDFEFLSKSFKVCLYVVKQIIVLVIDCIIDSGVKKV